MPRVTRAQAEAAVLDLDALTQRADELFSNIRGDWSDPRSDCRLGFESMARAAEKIELLRAYLAQRPDEETTYEAFRATSPENAALLAAARAQLGECCARHAQEPPNDVILRGRAVLDGLRRDLCPEDFTEDEYAAIRAAMYQPEEE